MSDKIKKILDSFVSMINNGQELHRYDFEEQIQQLDKRYRDSQRIELLLKKAAESNMNYMLIFDKLYGDMPKYGGGVFRL